MLIKIILWHSYGVSIFCLSCKIVLMRIGCFHLTVTVCYLADTLEGGGGVDLATTAKNQK